MDRFVLFMYFIRKQVLENKIYVFYFLLVRMVYQFYIIKFFIIFSIYLYILVVLDFREGNVISFLKNKRKGLKRIFKFLDVLILDISKRLEIYFQQLGKVIFF